MEDKIRNTARGFSLLEVTIAMGLMAAASMAFMKFQQNQIKASKTIENTYALNEFVHNFKGYLGKPGICSISFKDLTLRKDSKLPGIRRPDGEFKYEVGIKVPESHYKFSKMRFTNVFIDNQRLGQDSYRADVQLQLIFTKSSKMSYGGKSIIKSIELDLLVNQVDKVIECAPLGSLSLSRSLNISSSTSEVDSDGLENIKTLGKDEYDEAFVSAILKIQNKSGQVIDQKKLNKVMRGNKELQEAMKALEFIKKNQEALDKQMQDL